MLNYRITGGNPLFGSIRLGGAKNASYKLMIASLLADSPSRLLNFSHISDVKAVAQVIRSLGGQVKTMGERAMVIDPRGLKESQIDQAHGQAGRFSSIFLGPLLAKFKTAKTPLPGGDKIGYRPLDRHFDGLKKMGVKIKIENDQILASAPHGLSGCQYRFSKPSHTGTETLILAACKAKGQTVLENVGLEPEIDDLINFLNSAGADIRRRSNRVIQIEGKTSLKGPIHKIMTDRNEAVSYACAAIATKGDVIIENAVKSDLASFLDKLEEIGAGYEVGQYGIRFFYHQPLKSADITTSPEPGFMTDWQPLWATLLTQCSGGSQIFETVMEKRFQYVNELVKMGAKIKYLNPQIDDPEKFYQFEYSQSDPNQPHAIEITGPTSLKPGEFEVLDLRHGATLILAALIANGVSIVKNASLVERGYEELDQRLNSLGAKIEKFET